MDTTSAPTVTEALDGLVSEAYRVLHAHEVLVEAHLSINSDDARIARQNYSIAWSHFRDCDLRDDIPVHLVDQIDHVVRFHNEPMLAKAVAYCRKQLSN